MQHHSSIQQTAFFWMLKHCSDLVVILTLGGQILYISETAALLYDWNTEDSIGKNYFAELKLLGLRPPFSKEELLAADVENKLPQREIKTVIKSQKYTINWSVSGLDDIEKRNKIYAILGKDVTKQRQAEKKEKITALSLESIISCMPGNVYWLDKNSVFLGANLNSAKFMGYKSAAEMVGKTYEDFAKRGKWEAWQIEAFKNDDMEVKRTGKPRLNIEELPIKSYDGKVVSFLTSRVPIRDESNEVIGVVGMSIDITERKKIEEKLALSIEIAKHADKEKLKLLETLNQEVLGNAAKFYENIEDYTYAIRHYLLSIIECMPGNVYWMDRNCIYLGANINSAKFMGFNSPTEVVGKTYEDFTRMGAWDAWQGESFKRDDMEVMRTGKAKLNIEEPPVKRQNGELIYFLTSRVPIRDKNNEVTGVVGISVDITELKKTQEKLKQAEGRLDGMTLLSSSIAHELRTPLGTIITTGYALKEYFPMLIQAYKISEKNKENDNYISKETLELLSDSVDRIIRSAKSSNQIINMMLTNLIAQEKNIFAYDICSIVAIIKASIDEYTFPLGNKSKIDYSQVQDFRFYGEANFFKHVFFNLLKNAFYFMEKAGKGEIIIWTGEQEDCNLVYFQDTGFGIAADKIGKIFERFFTADTHHGTGVGLAFCRLVMETIGGDIECKSEFGKYTLFIMSFPKIEKIK